MDTPGLGFMQQYLENSGWQIIRYSGKLKDAPKQARHIFRDLGAGTYVCRLYGKPVQVVGVFETPHSDEQLSYAFFAVLYTELAAVPVTFYDHNNDGTRLLHVPDDYDYDNDLDRRRIDRLSEPGVYAVSEQGIDGPYNNLDSAVIGAAIRHGFLPASVKPIEGQAQTPDQPAVKPMVEVRMQAIAPELFRFAVRLADDPHVPVQVATEARRYVDWVYMKRLP